MSTEFRAPRFVVYRGINKLVEEMGEALCEIGKLKAYPDGNHPDGKGLLDDRVADELGDVLAAIDFLMVGEPRLDDARIIRRRQEKFAQYLRWDMSGIEREEP